MMTSPAFWPALQVTGTKGKAKTPPPTEEEDFYKGTGEAGATAWYRAQCLALLF